MIVYSSTQQGSQLRIVRPSAQVFGCTTHPMTWMMPLADLLGALHNERPKMTTLLASQTTMSLEITIPSGRSQKEHTVSPNYLWSSSSSRFSLRSMRSTQPAYDYMSSRKSAEKSTGSYLKVIWKVVYPFRDLSACGSQKSHILLMKYHLTSMWILETQVSNVPEMLSIRDVALYVVSFH
jgi:hypothetical protein